MQYRTFEKTGEKVSLLGFGTMRLPLKGSDSSDVDEVESIKMIRSAIDSGVNYIDTAYMYHDGKSEVIVGKALKDGYREKILLADKMPPWMAKDEAGIEKIFTEQLERLDTGCIDMYLVHNITAPIWKRTKELKVLPFLEKQRQLGKIKQIGFSFHDELPLFKEVIDAYPWDFCQIQLNYMDAEFQAGTEGLKYAGSKKIPVVIMEPLKGGKLTDAVPATVQKLWDDAAVKRTPAEWALRWAADFPEVLTILSGMNNMDQVSENIRVLETAEPLSLTASEQDTIAKAAAEYNRLIPYSCTACKYCMPCPIKIDIPSVIQYYNEWVLYEGSPKTKADFDTWISPKRGPGTCEDCKACEEHCPQHLPVSQIMKQAHVIFG